MIKHDTASTFVFNHDPQAGWRTGLVLHPLFRVWMMPGGHVEPDEGPSEAALREVREETGLDSVRLLQPQTPIPFTDSDTARSLPLPCWVAEHPIPDGDNHLREPHVHIDHKYVAITTESKPARQPDHPFKWYAKDELEALPMLNDARRNAYTLFSLMASQYSTNLGVTI